MSRKQATALLKLSKRELRTVLRLADFRISHLRNGFVETQAQLDEAVEITKLRMAVQNALDEICNVGC